MTFGLRPLAKVALRVDTGGSENLHSEDKWNFCLSSG